MNRRLQSIVCSPFACHARWFASHAIPVALLTAASYIAIGIPLIAVSIFLNR